MDMERDIMFISSKVSNLEAMVLSLASIDTEMVLKLINEMRDTIEDIVNSLNAIAVSLQKMQNEVHVMSKQMEQHEVKLQELYNSNKDLVLAVTKLDAQMLSLEIKMSQIDIGMADHLQKINHLIDTTNGLIDQVKQLKVDSTDFNARLENIKKILNDYMTWNNLRVDELKKLITEKFSEVSQEVETINIRLKELTTQIDVNKRQISRVETIVYTVSRRVEAYILANDAKIQSLSDRIEKCENRLETVDSRLTIVEEQATLVDGKFDALLLGQLSNVQAEIDQYELEFDDRLDFIYEQILLKDSNSDGLVGPVKDAVDGMIKIANDLDLSQEIAVAFETLFANMIKIVGMLNEKQAILDEYEKNMDNEVYVLLNLDYKILQVSRSLQQLLGLSFRREKFSPVDSVLVFKPKTYVKTRDETKAVGIRVNATGKWCACFGEQGKVTVRYPKELDPEDMIMTGTNDSFGMFRRNIVQPRTWSLPDLIDTEVFFKFINNKWELTYANIDTYKDTAIHVCNIMDIAKDAEARMGLEISETIAYVGWDIPSDTLAVQNISGDGKVKLDIRFEFSGINIIPDFPITRSKPGYFEITKLDGTLTKMIGWMVSVKNDGKSPSLITKMQQIVTLPNPFQFYEVPYLDTELRFSLSPGTLTADILRPPDGASVPPILDDQGDYTYDLLLRNLTLDVDKLQARIADVETRTDVIEETIKNIIKAINTPPKKTSIIPMLISTIIGGAVGFIPGIGGFLSPFVSLGIETFLAYKIDGGVNDEAVLMRVLQTTTATLNSVVIMAAMRRFRIPSTSQIVPGIPDKEMFQNVQKNLKKQSMQYIDANGKVHYETNIINTNLAGLSTAKYFANLKEKVNNGKANLVEKFLYNKMEKYNLRPVHSYVETVVETKNRTQKDISVFGVSEGIQGVRLSNFGPLNLNKISPRAQEAYAGNVTFRLRKDSSGIMKLVDPAELGYTIDTLKQVVARYKGYLPNNSVVKQVVKDCLSSPSAAYQVAWWGYSEKRRNGIANKVKDDSLVHPEYFNVMVEAVKNLNKDPYHLTTNNCQDGVTAIINTAKSMQIKHVDENELGERWALVIGGSSLLDSSAFR